MHGHQPVLLCTDARAWDFKETIWAVICADFHGNAAIAPDGVTFFAEKEGVEGMEAICRRREMRGRWNGRAGQARAVILHARCHLNRQLAIT